MTGLLDLPNEILSRIFCFVRRASFTQQEIPDEYGNKRTVAATPLTKDLVSQKLRLNPQIGH